MTRQNLVIDVNINPNEQPSSTATNVPENPNPATNGTNVKKIAEVAILANAVKQVGMSTLGQVGAITGNAQTQRTINKASKLLGFGLAFKINPFLGAVSLATSVGTTAIQTALKIRDENNSAEYYRRVNGRRIDKGRLK